MSNKEKLKYRMYGLTPYNLSSIQQGIQVGHAVVEYMLNFPPDLNIYSDTKQWAEEDKTFIILNGGTTNFGIKGRAEGTLNQHAKTLKSMGVKTAEFYEPDLGDQLTAVVFLLDERVWNEEEYPSPNPEMMDTWGNYIDNMGGDQVWALRQFIKQFRLA